MKRINNIWNFIVRKIVLSVTLQQNPTDSYIKIKKPQNSLS